VSALAGWLGDDEREIDARLERMRRQLLMFFRHHLRGDDAEDMAQNAFLAFVSACDTPKPPDYERPEQLLFGIAWNHLRQRWSQRRVPLEPVEAIDKLNGPPLPEYADSDEASCRKQCFGPCLSALDESDRRLLIEYKLSKGKERSDLGRDLKMSAVALRVGAHRAKTRLQARMNECIEACRTRRNTLRVVRHDG
jgi:DNA-directed RNA polymerase specialized sigma24 family protein